MDMGLEWLSTFVEDCLTSTGSSLPPPPPPPPLPPAATSDLDNVNKKTTSLFLQRIAIPGKARSKRKRHLSLSSSSSSARTQFFSDPPPLLQVEQAYWLADSELIVNPNNTSSKNQEQQQRRCSHCLAQRTPQWRGGPLGPKTLCNACGVRYKSGRLLPEYRPAKSPTFVSYKHSNSHKKVMEMRMSLL